MVYNDRISRGLAASLLSLLDMKVMIILHLK
jgi:hypothetical protein